ncbi:WSC domain-containing protein [Fusarium pseudoanthophilum]|uniref:WSC domain-containing protein n=1 Tax=Fusarium pseudoanthophilum TaxID=48495 RepID=A0A8H5KIP5_9HYPO|nr:WSC domain-containing protein [Fusarium pseudoanthophilum]
MDFDTARASTCTTCKAREDLSNYWIPNLYYRAPDGTFEDVPQTGGMLVYYLQRSDPKDPEYEKGLLAFPEGFQMLAGNPHLRSFKNTLEQRAISYACLGVSGPETHEIPPHNCPNGLRAQVMFPSCWDGKNLDSPDHKSHMAYPDRVDSGVCPRSHPKRLVTIFYEVVFQIDQFKDRWHGSSHPFVFSNGDPTGYGLHGDFLNGWDVKVLQKAVKECTDASGVIEKCSALTFFDDDAMNGCRVPVQVDEKTNGVLKSLPGCNPVTFGPEPATPVVGEACNATKKISPPKWPFTDVTDTNKFRYLGCAKDTYGSRSLNMAQTSADNMTIESCLDYCEHQGYLFAGLEYGRECYCGNAVDKNKLPVKGQLGKCEMPCAGNKEQVCGGPGALSLYQKCKASEGSCKNAEIISRFRVYTRSSDPDLVAAPTRSKPSAPGPVDTSCHDADDESINAHERDWHLFFGEHSRPQDVDVSDETTSVPSPISNAVYDSGRILVQLANLPTVHLNEAQHHLTSVATTAGMSGEMSSPLSNSIAVQSEVPRRESTIPEAFDFVVSPSPFGTDESLPHLPAMVAAHALTPSNDCQSAGGLASTDSTDRKSEIVETDPELSFFLRQFADTMGNWMDLFDMDRHYHRVIPMLAWSSPLLLYSACAVAAKQLTLVKPSLQEPQFYIHPWQTSFQKDFAWYSTKYYDRAISLLLGYVSNLSSGDSGQENALQQSKHGHNPKPCGNEIIIAATILSVYEFLTASDQTWSEHLDGIRSFIGLSEELGFNFQPTSAGPVLDPLLPSLLRAACWNFARQDFLAALINGHKTRLDTENPVIWRRMGLSVTENGKPITHVDSRVSEDAHSESLRPDIISNTLVWLLSKLANYVATATDSKQQPTSTHSLEATWLSLKQEFETWHRGLPSSFRPSYRVRRTPQHNVERSQRCRHQTESLICYETWYSSSMCASSMQSYHMSQILLLIHKPEGLVVPFSQPSASGGPLDALTRFNQMNRVLQYHAAEICAIALSRPEAAARIHMLQPVYLAGRCLHTKADRAIVLGLLESIEIELGWSSRYRVDDLLREWGMDRHEIMHCCN